MTYDLITVGRVNMDLFSQQVGVPFERIQGFDAMVGGSPTNIAIGTSRLGLRSIAFTGIGDDRVGDFVLRYLNDENVVTDHVVRKSGKLTSLALLGVEPPDHFPLSFYREDPADIHLTVDDAAALPLADSAALLLSGNAFSRGTCADACRHLAEASRGMTTFMDLDLRPTEWPEPGSFGATLRPVLAHVDVVIGTEEECYALLTEDPTAAMDGTPLPDEARDQVADLVRRLVADHPGMHAVLKRGPVGVSIVSEGEWMEVPGFTVDVVNTVGAGDAFASGLIAKRLGGWDWYNAARFANACGAIEVTRHGCSVALPTEAEVERFIDEHGGM